LERYPASASGCSFRVAAIEERVMRTSPNLDAEFVAANQAGRGGQPLEVLGAKGDFPIRDGQVLERLAPSASAERLAGSVKGLGRGHRVFSASRSDVVHGCSRMAGPARLFRSKIILLVPERRPAARPREILRGRAFLLSPIFLAQIRSA
jgi:hypothetical protein